MALKVKFNDQFKRIKVTPGMAMSQIIVEARKQYGLLDLHQYQLLHRGKPMDLSIPFRLTGISINASVDLVELDGAVEMQHVRVCIQLRDCNRVQATFESNTTIAGILTFFKLFPASEKFFLEYLRRLIDYDAFSTTTLKELGILSGSVMFRVLIANEQLATLAAQNTIHESRVFSAPNAFTPPSSTLLTSEALEMASVMQPDDVKMEDIAAKDQTTDVSIHIMASYDALQILRDNNLDAVSRVAIVTLLKIVTNILFDLENEKLRTIRLSNATFQRSVGQVKGGIDFLRSIGFAINPVTQMLELKLTLHTKSVLEEGLRVLSIEANDLNISTDTRPVPYEDKTDPSFDVFKTHITRVQMQPRGPSTTEFLVDALKSRQEQLVGYKKPARNTTIVLERKQESDRTDVALENNEQFDAQLLMSNFKARQDKMDKTRSFRTRAMCELDELKRKRVFQKVLIRVHFPDQAIMQANFHPNETIQDVMDHVTECLDDRYNANKFYLYVTPPTQILAATKTLSELNLVPAALTYLSWLEIPAQADVAGIGFYFRRDVLADQFTKSGGGPTHQTDYPQPLLLECLPNAATTESCEEPMRQGSARAKSPKKPSWLKL